MLNLIKCPSSTHHLHYEDTQVRLHGTRNSLKLKYGKEINKMNERINRIILKTA